MANEYYYFLCNPKTEFLLKEEISLFYPELAFSFSTTGMVTFKQKESRLRGSLRPVFCRRVGKFIAKDASLETIKNLIPKNHSYSLFDLEGNIFEEYNFASEKIFEIIVLKNMYYLGYFRKKTLQKENPGAFFALTLPANAPSRAYLKAAETQSFLSVTEGDIALEIGSAPGGASYFLLEQGLKVIGIDPGEMKITSRQLTHMKISIQKLNIKELPLPQWLWVDVNLAPEASLGEIARIIPDILHELKGVFLTIKLTKISLIKRIPQYIKWVKRMGLSIEVATQLTSHHQEFLIIATPTRKIGE